LPISAQNGGHFVRYNGNEGLLNIQYMFTLYKLYDPILHFGVEKLEQWPK